MTIPFLPVSEPHFSPSCAPTEKSNFLAIIHSEAQVAEVAKELAEARKAVGEGHADESRVAAIHARFTYRMHDLEKALNHRHEIRNEEVAGRWKMVSKD